MQSETQAKIYAESLYRITFAQGQTEACLDQLKDLASLLRNATISDFLVAPTIPVEKKQSIVDDLFANTSLPDYLHSFCLLLIENKKFSLLPLITTHYIAMVDRMKGIIDILLISAFPIEKEEELITKAIERASGKKVKLRRKIDPTLLGGVKIIHGDRVLDGSVSGYLANLKETVTRR